MYANFRVQIGIYDPKFSLPLKKKYLGQAVQKHIKPFKSEAEKDRVVSSVSENLAAKGQESNASNALHG